MKKLLILRGFEPTRTISAFAHSIATQHLYITDRHFIYTLDTTHLMAFFLKSQQSKRLWLDEHLIFVWNITRVLDIFQRDFFSFIFLKCDVPRAIYHKFVRGFFSIWLKCSCILYILFVSVWFGRKKQRTTTTKIAIIIIMYIYTDKLKALADFLQSQKLKSTQTWFSWQHFSVTNDQNKMSKQLHYYCFR